MSLCVMFSGFEQQHRHRDGRNNKADRSRHLWQPWVERAATFDDRARALSLRCSAMEGTVGTVGKWKRERRHRAVCSTSPISSQPQPHFRNSLEPLDMTTTASNGGGGGAAAAASRPTAAPLPPKERASVIMASPAVGLHRASSTTTTTTTGGMMSDPVIDEHFRRSLGKDYMNVFAPAVAQRDQQQQQQQQSIQEADERAQAIIAAAELAEARLTGPGLSAVDDHFAKALGDTWVKLQKEEYQKRVSEAVAEANRRRQKLNVYAA